MSKILSSEIQKKIDNKLDLFERGPVESSSSREVPKIGI